MRTKINVIATLLIVIGIIGFAFTKFDLGVGQPDLVKVEKSWEFTRDTLNSLSIVGKSENVNIEFAQSNDEQGSIQLVGDFEEEMNEHFDKMLINNQALTLDLSHKGKQRLISFRFNENKTNITIQLPKEMTLESFNVKISSGDMNISNLLSKQSTLSITSGNFTLNKANSNEISITSSSGHITLDQITANVDVKQKSGNIKISNVTGQLETNAQSGNTTISDVFGELTAKTGSGNITINHLNGGLQADSSSGNVKVNEQYNGEINVSTTSGNVELVIDEKFDGLFELRSSSGNIEAPPSIGESKRKVQVKTNSGNIKINTKAITANNKKIDVREEIGRLSDIWAKALISRDGAPRYKMMSDQAKQKFEKEQVEKSGEEWNFVIGYSSPGAIDYDIEIDGMTAKIKYITQTSEPAYYHTMDIVKFSADNHDVAVEDYETDIEVEASEAL